MAETTITRYYREEEFSNLAPGFGLDANYLATVLGALALSEPVAEVRKIQAGEAVGVAVAWAGIPSNADVAAVDAAVAAFTGGPTTSEPFVEVSTPATTASNATPVTKIDITTPPLEAGTYQVIFSCQYRMQAVVAGDAARAISIVTPSGTSARQQVDHWGESVAKAYNGAATFKRTTGQTIRVQLLIAEVGPGTGTAEMSDARVSVDKIG